MNTDEWISWLVDACEKGGMHRADLSARFGETAAQSVPATQAMEAIRMPIGNLSPEQHELATSAFAAAFAKVFSAAERGQLFGPISRVRDKYGERIDAYLTSGADEFQKLARTFATFDAELDDLATLHRSILVYHILKKVEISIRGLFFPSQPPTEGLDRDLLRQVRKQWVRVPDSQRIQAMREVLGRFAPSLNTESFVHNNPTLGHEQSRSGCMTAALLTTSTLLIPTIFVVHLS